MGIDDAFIKIERPGFAVRGDKLSRRRDVLAIGKVDLVKIAVPGHGINRVLAWRGHADRRNGRLSTRAQRILSRCGALVIAGVVFAPENRALLRIDGKKIVRHAGDKGDFFRPGLRGHPAGHQRREQIAHDARLAIQLQLPQQLHVLHRRGAEQLLFFLPVCAFEIVTARQPVRAPAENAARRHNRNE